jgi:hypothetical protein
MKTNVKAPDKAKNFWGCTDRSRNSALQQKRKSCCSETPNNAPRGAAAIA